MTITLSYNCTECGKAILAGPGGYFTGCEHYPLEPRQEPHGRTDFIGLIVEHQLATNPVTKAVTRNIIKKRIDACDYT